jgi:hypothetical protein
MTAADNCAENDTGVARLDTTVAPYLQSLGFKGTGSVVTGSTLQSSELCTHYNDSLSGSWDDAGVLANQFGWAFISHTADYPGPYKMAHLTAKQQYNETCGSAATIDAHGLPGGHGMIAYPGAQKPPLNLQSTYGVQCFDWGRTYGHGGLTQQSAATTAPYWQNTEAVAGGPCADSALPCFTMTAQGSKRYSQPSAIIAQLNSLQPGQWLTLQAYVLVTGASPTYSQNQTKWDCTSANSADHWSNDVERYCYSDYQQIVAAITQFNANAAAAGTAPITVADPLTVGIAFGRPSFTPSPSGTATVTPTPSPTASPSP